ncbi:MAG: hypothetical protein ACRDUY_14715, partial [Nitriliruptorales bacterium]
MEGQQLIDVLRITGAALAIGVTAWFAVRRIAELVGLLRAAQPDPERGTWAYAISNLKYQLTKVLGQKKLLRWSVPGVFHAWIFWSFLVVQATLIEIAGEIFDPHFKIPLAGRIRFPGSDVDLLDVVVFTQDAFILLGIVAIAGFLVMRLTQHPNRLGRRSRFAGSNLDQGYWVLMGEFGVTYTLLLLHGARVAEGGEQAAHFAPAFLSQLVGQQLVGIPETGLQAIVAAMVVVHIAIVGWFLVFTLSSKHLHVLTIFPQVAVSRQPKALGALPPMDIDLEAMDEETVLGVGKVEDLTWTTFLDLYTCTECGRC